MTTDIEIVQVLTLPAKKYGNIVIEERPPSLEMIRFVKAILRLTNTTLDSWKFSGQPETQAAKDGYFSALHGNEYSIKFSLTSGLFSCNSLEVDAVGLAQLLQGANVAAKPIPAKQGPRKRYGLSKAALSALEKLESL